MPRTTEQNQIIREATQSRLIESALALFAERGYAHTSIRKIADHAGVSLGLLYHYFSSKESLLTAVFDNTMVVISMGFAPISEIDNPLEKINYLVTYIFDALQEDRTYWGLFYSLRSQPAVMVILGDSIRLWTRRLRSLFEEFLRERGSQTPEIDALLLYSMIEGTIQQYLLDHENYPLGEIRDRIISEYQAAN